MCDWLDFAGCELATFLTPRAAARYALTNRANHQAHRTATPWQNYWKDECLRLGGGYFEWWNNFSEWKSRGGKLSPTDDSWFSVYAEIRVRAKQIREAIDASRERLEFGDEILVAVVDEQLEDAVVENQLQWFPFLEGRDDTQSDDYLLDVRMYRRFKKSESGDGAVGELIASQEPPWQGSETFPFIPEFTELCETVAEFGASDVKGGPESAYRNVNFNSVFGKRGKFPVVDGFFMKLFTAELGVYRVFSQCVFGHPTRGITERSSRESASCRSLAATAEGAKPREVWKKLSKACKRTDIRGDPDLLRIKGTTRRPGRATEDASPIDAKQCERKFYPIGTTESGGELDRSCDLLLANAALRSQTATAANGTATGEGNSEANRGEAATEDKEEDDDSNACGEDVSSDDGSEEDVPGVVRAATICKQLVTDGLVDEDRLCIPWLNAKQLRDISLQWRLQSVESLRRAVLRRPEWYPYSDGSLWELSLSNCDRLPNKKMNTNDHEHNCHVILFGPEAALLVRFHSDHC